MSSRRSLQIDTQRYDQNTASKVEPYKFDAHAEQRPRRRDQSALTGLPPLSVLKLGCLGQIARQKSKDSGENPASTLENATIDVTLGEESISLLPSTFSIIPVFMNTRAAKIESPVRLSPTFENPPVVETALSVQFSGIRWSPLDCGIYYETIRERFPNESESYCLPPIIETFPTTIVDSKLVVSETLQPSRWLFGDSPNSSLLQVQYNRFGFNWRKEEGEKYPRFQNNCELFKTEYGNFLSFCEARNLGSPEPQFSEVVYVNDIYPDDGQELIDIFENAFKGVDFSVSPRPELATFNRTFVIGDNDGRLYAEAGILPNEKIRFKLTSRARCTDGDWNSSLNIAHDVLIEHFVNLTEPTMHTQKWGLQ